MDNCFVELERALMNQGLIEDGQRLHLANNAVYTTSSEMYGEIGAMVQTIYRSIPLDAAAALRSHFIRCEREVRRVWPQFSLVPRSV